MINKTNLWFITLTSIILVVAIYYIAIEPNNTAFVYSSVEPTRNVEVSIEESEALTAMRVNKESENNKKYKELQDILLNDSSTVDDKNKAYDNIKYLMSNKNTEEKLEEYINKEFNTTSFINIKDNNIEVVLINQKPNKDIALDIIIKINEYLKSNYYVTVKFE